MTIYSRRTLLKAGVGAAAAGLFTAGVPRAWGDPFSAPPTARLGKVHGTVPTLFVDGQPFLIAGAQCDVWRAVHQDAATIAFFDAYQEMNATTVSMPMPWSKIELSEGHYDFTFLDWYIRQAQTRGLKLVLHLFNTNVCGKVQEGDPKAPYPVYPPAYLLNAPDQYQRMTLLADAQAVYDADGPPMCPNDPRTLERERLYVTKVAEHLTRTDTHRTVILLQLDNEFYYQQWVPGKAPVSQPDVRCTCRFCTPKWNTGRYKSGEDFMFHSFADYVRPLTDAIQAMTPLPVYLNSPWWSPTDVAIFLDNCPHVAFVGIDGVFDPHEPTILSVGQVSRNIPFAAECPTEQPKTRFHLDVLPYYVLLGPQGIGNLLWEAPPPRTVMDDEDTKRRYSAALYPIKHANRVIAAVRGTDTLAGWYVLRNFETGVAESTVIREGSQQRTIDGNQIRASVGGITFSVQDSPAGFVVRRGGKELIVATAAAKISLKNKRIARAEAGRFDGERWIVERPLTVHNNERLELTSPVVARLILKS